VGETTVNELAKPFAMSLPAVSGHLKYYISELQQTETSHARTRKTRR
jgi:hypothetical protein